jgi:hypothetical protein
MENEKVSAPVIPGNLAYCITRKPKVNQYTSIDTAFLDLQWLLKARSKDITRPNITGILVEPAKIIATDGHRLHIITNPYPSIPPGEYEVSGVNQSKVILIAAPLSKDIFTPFPDWNRTSITMEGNTPEHEITVDHPSYLYIEILKRRIVDLHLLEGAISDEPMNVRIYSENQPVIITTKTRTAIVMPLLSRKVS